MAEYGPAIGAVQGMDRRCSEDAQRRGVDARGQFEEPQAHTSSSTVGLAEGHPFYPTEITFAGAEFGNRLDHANVGGLGSPQGR